VGRLDPIFKADLPVVEAQIIQESLEHIRILVVPSAGFDDDVQAGLRQRVRDRLGKVSVSIETVTQIPRQANGKFRAVISRLKP
jgi:phenylacetate-CoA ligase